MTLTVSNKQARHLILHLQGLCGRPNVKQSLAELDALIQRLGFVQLDSIQWVERAQHMTLFARNQTYRPKHLKQLLEDKRALFEHWTHDASVIPTEFYPYWRHKFERERERLATKFGNWQGDGFMDHRDSLRERISTEGALMSRDLEREKKGPQEMWQWHDGKAALEYLWRTGELCIHSRSGFQKVYDLARKGVPDHHYDREVTHDEFIDWACRSALERLGFGTARDIAKFWDLLSIKEVQTWLTSQGDNSVLEIEVEGAQRADRKPFFARRDIQSLIANLPKLPDRVRVLSPFDPVIRDRNRLSWLFAFDYRIEIYVPEAKRQWGYYVFPLLEKDRVIGRIDMRAKRKEGILEVKRLWLEPNIKLSAARASRIEAELQRQARLAGVGDVTWLSVSRADL